MKNKIASIAIAAVVGISAIVPASAALRLQSLETDNSQATTIHYRYKKHSHYGHHKPKRHKHYHCHRRLVYGYWKKSCHRAWHNPHGRHHGHSYH